MLISLRSIAGALACGLLFAVLSVPAPAAADESPARFERFCQTWMLKLAEREEHNRSKVGAPGANGEVTLDYTGYDRNPVRCEAKATGVPSNPYVGKLVYKEFRYRITGPSMKRALTSKPQLLGATQVMEIFRFDGSNWVY
jgi:hypothetical protein